MSRSAGSQHVRGRKQPVSSRARRLSVVRLDPDTDSVANDDIVRRAEEHLDQAVERSSGERELPWHKQLSEEDRPYISPVCDVCRDELLDESKTLDGWVTEAQKWEGDVLVPSEESVRHYVLCTPCKELWERGDYNALYDRCRDAPGVDPDDLTRRTHRVDDLAQLAGDTIRIDDPHHDRGDGFGYEW
jgi:hypothetical protein